MSFGRKLVRTTKNLRKPFWLLCVLVGKNHDCVRAHHNQMEVFFDLHVHAFL